MRVDIPEVCIWNNKNGTCINQDESINIKNLFGDFLIRVDKLFPIPLSQKENLEILASKFEQFGTVSYIMDNNKIVSFCAGYTNDMEKKLAYISVVACLPEYANKGYGKLTVEKFIEKAKSEGMDAIHLYAEKHNFIALHMYEKLGFSDYIIKDEPRPNNRHLILWLV